MTARQCVLYLQHNIFLCVHPCCYGWRNIASRGVPNRVTSFKLLPVQVLIRTILLFRLPIHVNILGQKMAVSKVAVCTLIWSGIPVSFFRSWQVDCNYRRTTLNNFAVTDTYIINITQCCIKRVLPFVHIHAHIPRNDMK